MRRKGLAAGIAAGVVVAVSAGIFYTEWWVPNIVKLRDDPEFMGRASAAEQVHVAHQALRWSWGNHHDALVILSKNGGPESVPVLIRALQWQEDTKPGGNMLCTKAHCLSALKRITGENPGYNYADWAKWWKENGEKWRQEHATQGEEKR